MISITVDEAGLRQVPLNKSSDFSALGHDSLGIQSLEAFGFNRGDVTIILISLKALLNRSDNEMVAIKSDSDFSPSIAKSRINYTNEYYLKRFQEGDFLLKDPLKPIQIEDIRNIFKN
jgi:hypothetical protein